MAVFHARRTNFHSFYNLKMAESLTECRAAYQFKLWWVDEIYEGGIEQIAEGDRSDRIYNIGIGYTPKERGLTYYWQPIYELSEDFDRLRMFKIKPDMECVGFQLMAIEKEGCEYIPVVIVRMDYRTGTCSLIAAKSFARGDVITVMSEFEAKQEEKVLIFGGRCAERGDPKTKEGGKSFNATITPSRTIRCVRKIIKGEEIIVNYDPVRGDPLNFLDRVVRSKSKFKTMGRIVGFKGETSGVLLDVEFEGDATRRKCMKGQVNYVYLR
jgi:hypothetical protein